ncbi:MAG TPA: very short patch repair endonuclease [Candidatus Saccharimonadales bacterium]|jgi:DNA mismatch endonuclease (patch repair protein)
MVDIFTPEKRSEIMSRIRGKNTKPELLVYRYLRQNKIYFQKHYRTREGIVLDLALPRKKRAVLIDGDFWHGRTIEKVVERRGENDFWTRKLRRNIERDAEQRQILSNAGWKLMRVWESDLTKKVSRETTLIQVRKYLLK